MNTAVLGCAVEFSAEHCNSVLFPDNDIGWKQLFELIMLWFACN